MGPPGERFGTPGGAFWQSRGGRFDTLGKHWGVVLAPVGSIWASQGPPGTPCETILKKVAKKWFAGPLRDPPGEPILRHFPNKYRKRAMSELFWSGVRP